MSHLVQGFFDESICNQNQIICKELCSLNIK